MNRPIIVLGKERSGTKWLTNLIANHPEIACVQSPQHKGILETNMFDKMEAAFGDLKYKENRMAFEYVFVQTAFFKITGLDSEWFCNLKYTSYLEAFKLVMDAYAHKTGAKTWVQKTNSLLADKLFEEYSNAKFIVIQRELMDNVASTLNMGDYSFEFKSVLSAVFGHVYNKKYEDKYRNKDNVFFVTYENLKAKTEVQLREVYEFLGLEFDPVYCEVPFKKNTSFQKRKRKEFSSKEKFVIRCMYYTALIMPLPILKFFRNQLQKYRIKKHRFVGGTFQMS
ncbi:sulfotransferase [uncultured Winogradskyella sp.]|uniref:sulfotransferase family protein n=1 Tax=uncultured Winogradskyella sp. TaxID=395353 RepID=UPI00351525B0